LVLLMMPRTTPQWRRAKAGISKRWLNESIYELVSSSPRTQQHNNSTIHWTDHVGYVSSEDATTTVSQTNHNHHRKIQQLQSAENQQTGRKNSRAAPLHHDHGWLFALGSTIWSARLSNRDTGATRNLSQQQQQKRRCKISY